MDEFITPELAESLYYMTFSPDVSNQILCRQILLNIITDVNLSDLKKLKELITNDKFIYLRFTIDILEKYTHIFDISLLRDEKSWARDSTFICIYLNPQF